MTCMICLSDRIRVPCAYKETCFGCKKIPGRPSCHSISRYCLMCIRGHLQLNKPWGERAEVLKCPLCPATTNPQRLKAQTAYEPDYRMMSMDPATDYACFHSERGCKFQGGQMELHKHMGQCAFSTIACRYCHQYLEKRHEKEHKAVCPRLIDCVVPGCHERIGQSLQDIHRHRIDVHHDKICIHCQEWIKADAHESHEVSCPHRPTACRHCVDRPQKKDRQKHLQMHMSEVASSMEFMTRQMASLRTRMDRLLEDMNE